MVRGPASGAVDSSLIPSRVKPTTVKLVFTFFNYDIKNLIIIQKAHELLVYARIGQCGHGKYSNTGKPLYMSIKHAQTTNL